jgi:hypothetical protein
VPVAQERETDDQGRDEDGELRGDGVANRPRARSRPRARLSLAQVRNLRRHRSTHTRGPLTPDTAECRAICARSPALERLWRRASAESGRTASALASATRGRSRSVTPGRARAGFCSAPRTKRKRHCRNGLPMWRRCGTLRCRRGRVTLAQCALSRRCCGCVRRGLDELMRRWTLAGLARGELVGSVQPPRWAVRRP